MLGQPKSETARRQGSGSVSATPDVFLREEQMAVARDVLERFIGAQNTRLAFISGSLAAGLGHGLSDIDIYVQVTDGDVPETNHLQAGQMIHLNRISDAQIETIRATCSEYSDTPGQRLQTDIDDASLTLAVRFAIGVPLVNTYTDLPSAEQSKLTIRRILMNRNSYECAGLAEDVLGALQISDTLTAVQASHMVVEAALECVLAGAGDVYLGRKFQLRRSARVPALRPVLDDLIASLRQPDLSMGLAEARELVLGRLLFSSHLIASALLDGWDEPLTAVPAFEDCRAQGGPLRSPWVIPVRFASRWGMSGPHIGYRVTESMVRLWRALDGRPAAALLSELQGSGLRISADVLEATVAQLVEKKAALWNVDAINCERG